MLPGPAWAILTDPVCGRSVEYDSPHRIVHGGALFAFCSLNCQAHFLELPSRYAIIAPSAPRATDAHATPEGVAEAVKDVAAAPGPAQQPVSGARQPATDHPPHPTAPRPTVPPPRTAVANALPQSREDAAASGGAAMAKAQDAADRRPLASTAASGASISVATTRWAPLPEGMPLAGERGPFTWMHAWRERRYARECARDMLTHHRAVSTQYPELKGASLYRRIVAARLGGDTLAAQAVLEHATQSFAIWPVERPLNFRDVVHYLAVSQYVATHPGTRWVHADIKRVVETLVPSTM